MKNLLPIFSFFSILSLTSCGYDKKDIPNCLVDTTHVTYANKAKMIIDQTCATNGCHVQNGSSTFDFTTYLGVIDRVNAGSFETRILLPPSDLSHMPQNTELSSCDFNTLMAWVHQGAQ